MTTMNQGFDTRANAVRSEATPRPAVIEDHYFADDYIYASALEAARRLRAPSAAEPGADVVSALTRAFRRWVG